MESSKILEYVKDYIEKKIIEYQNIEHIYISDVECDNRIFAYSDLLKRINILQKPTENDIQINNNSE